MILSVDEWQEFSGVTLTADEGVSAAAVCQQVSDAITRKCRPWRFEPITVSNWVMDAPMENELVLPVLPVRSITSLYRRVDASGDVSLFTSDYLLTNYTDYLLVVDDPVNGWSKSGLVRYRQYSSWGSESMFPLGRLTAAMKPARGAIKVTFTAGFTTVPGEVKQAAALAVGLLWNRRAGGAPVTSESWNGWSGSYSGPFTTEAVLNTPDVAGLLAGYCSVQVGTS